ncbi:MAG: PAS domain-containing protein [Candidatus Fermentibacteraceae bacterium]
MDPATAVAEGGLAPDAVVFDRYGEPVSYTRLPPATAVPCGLGCSECSLIDCARPPVCPGCPVREALRTGRPCSRSIALEDGQRRTLICRPLLDPSGVVSGAVAVMECDPPDRVLYAQLSRYRERLQAVLESSRLAWWEEDFTTGRVERSESWATMLGYGPEELPPQKDVWLGLVHPDDLDAVREEAARHERGETDSFEVEHRLRARDGSWRWILNWGRIVERDEEGNPVRALGTHLEITERKRAELERERLIEDLSSALDKIRTLRGIVPICSHCKKIRDDSGYWEQLEVFLRQHSMAEFSHSLCPDCLRELYGSPCGGPGKEEEGEADG